MDYSITFGDLHSLALALKVNKFHKVTDTDLNTAICLKFEIDEDDEEQKKELKNAVRNYFKVDERRRKKKGAYDKKDLDTVVLCFSAKVDVESETECNSTVYRMSLRDVSKRQQYQRTAEIITHLNKVAQDNKCTVNELLGILVKQINYKTNRKSASVGDMLLNTDQNNNNSEMSLTKATYLKHELQLGRGGYLKLKKTLSSEPSPTRLPSISLQFVYTVLAINKIVIY